MATFTGMIASGSTNGKNIKIAATATAGTLLHTATSGTGNTFDEVYAWFTNTSTAPVSITIEWGGVASPDDHIVKDYTLQPNSPPVPLITGQRLQNSLVVRCFASTANVVVANIYHNRVA